MRILAFCDTSTGFLIPCLVTARDIIPINIRGDQETQLLSDSTAVLKCKVKQWEVKPK